MINAYFTELENSLENVPPQNIINYDETNFSDDPGRQKVIVKRGARHSERYMDSSKTSVSVMMGGSAAGHILPPYVVYKALHLYDTWTQNGIKGARYNRSKSGWFDLTIFEDWFFQIALQYFRQKDGPKVMIGDNLSSHLSDRVMSACREHNIRFILLPPNSTHLCQPLDVAFFKPVKSAWRDVLLDWKQKNKGCIPKDQFPRLLRQTLEKVKPDNLVAGFRATGIYPLNREEVLKRLPDWSQPPLNQEAVNNTFADLLRQTRFPDENKQIKRKKRLDVIAGKSVSFHTTTEDNDLSSDDDVSNEATNVIESEDDNTKTRTKSPRPSTSQESDTSLSDSHMSVHDSDSDNWDEFDFESNEYNEGDYILVQFIPETKRRQAVMYVGQVQEVLRENNDNILYCKFLRMTVGTKMPKNSFKYPEIDDLSIVDINQVKMKLPVPKSKRGIYTFPGHLKLS